MTMLFLLKPIYREGNFYPEASPIKRVKKRIRKILRLKPKVERVHLEAKAIEAQKEVLEHQSALNLSNILYQLDQVIGRELHLEAIQAHIRALIKRKREEEEEWFVLHWLQGDL